MVDSEKNGRMTTAEAAQLLGYSISWTIETLKEQGIENIRRNGGGNRAPLLWDRAEVEWLFRERQPSNEKKAPGLKRCGICREWKKKATEFHKRCFVCKRCRPAYDRERKAQHKYPSTFGNRNPDPQPPGPIGLFVAVGKPPGPRDSLQYACMDIGYSHRPLPIVDGRRVSKREAFCSKCEAPHCVHHPHLRPAVVRKMK